MTNFEILGALQNTRLRLLDLDLFIVEVRSLAADRENLLNLYADIAAFDGKQANYLSRMNQDLSRIVGEVQNFSSRQFYESTFKLSKLLNELTSEVTIAHPIIGKLLHELDALQNAFDAFTQSHAPRRALNVVLQSDRFIEAFDSYIEYTEFISGVLRSGHARPEPSGTLDLYMPAELNLDEFIARLRSISIIYQELAQILGISTSDEPLKILKVESGSLWASVFGHSKIMALMDDFLRGGARYVSRNYTNEGKIEALPTSLKGMNEILDFAKRLEESGVDVKEIQEQLAKNTFIIAKEMNVLLENQSSVTINGENIPLAEARRQGQLEARHVPRLQDHSQNT